MSWRSGSSMFLEFWPLLQKHIPDQAHRIEFTANLLNLFVRDDMDPWEVEDVHPDIRAALIKAGIGLAEPEKYEGES